MVLSLEGIIVPIITPRIGDNVDYGGLQKVAERAIHAGVGGIFALGTTGEFNALPIPYRKGVIDALVESTRGKVPLLVGVSSQADSQTWCLIDYCNIMKVDCLVAAPEFGSQMKPEEITARTSVPILLYNNPEIHRGAFLPFWKVDAWSKDRKIIGIKDSSGKAPYFETLMRINSSNFRVFQGRESEAPDAHTRGAYGLVAGTVNVHPEEFVTAWKTGNFNSVFKLRERISQRSANYVRGLKLVLEEEGVIDSAEMWS